MEEVAFDAGRREGGVVSFQEDNADNVVPNVPLSLELEAKIRHLNVRLKSTEMHRKTLDSDFDT